MDFVGNLSLFAAAKRFCKSIKKSIAMVRVAQFFDSQCILHCAQEPVAEWLNSEPATLIKTTTASDCQTPSGQIS